MRGRAHDSTMDNSIQLLYKKAGIRRILFLVALCFFVYFMFLTVLPGNERVIVCAANDNFCTASDGDTDAGACTAYGTCNGGPGWSLGSGDCTGDASCATTSRCGDDAGEAVVAESSSTDTPSGYNDAVTACCNVATDCNYNGACVATGSASSASTPDKAYCGTGSTWYGGDYSEDACTAVAGTGSWNIGGEINTTVCCGDDSGENKNTRQVSEISIDNGFADNSSDKACCLAGDSCISSGTCYANGTSPADVDGDGDNDYCDAGTWQDCNSDSDCSPGLICSSNDCTDVNFPYFTSIPGDETTTYGNWEGVDFNADDAIGVDTYDVNDTRFTINSSGFLDEDSAVSAGAYSLNVSVNDTSGNTNSTIFTLTVNKATPSLSLNFNSTSGNTTIYTGSSMVLNGSIVSGDSGAVLQLYNNGTLADQAAGAVINDTLFGSAGTYNITVVYMESQNYTSGSLSYFIGVSDPDLTAPYFTLIPSNATITYGSWAGVDFNADDNIDIGDYTVNDSRFTISSSGLLDDVSVVAAGTYSLDITINDTSGNTNSTVFGLTVNRAASSLTLTVNSTSGNSTVHLGSAILLNSTIVSGDTGATLQLYNNGTLINQGAGSISNNTQFSSSGLYNITAAYPETQNYTSGSQTYYVTVADILQPYFTAIPSNESIIYGQNWSGADFNATDSNGFDSYSVADSRFTINSSGFLDDAAILNASEYLINITINDTSGNYNSAIFNLTVFADSDGDDIADINDTLNGNESTPAVSGINNLNITIRGNSSRGSFQGRHPVVIKEDSDVLVNFSHNFTAAHLNLSKVHITKGDNFILLNFSGQLLTNKTVYFDDSSYISLCVKDAPVSASSDISAACTGANETDFTSCIGNSTGTTINNITCYDEGSRFKFDNLHHTGIKGSAAAEEEESGGSSSGGSSSGGSSDRKYDFSVTPEKTTLGIKQGETREFTLRVANNNSYNIVVKAWSTLAEFMTLEEIDYHISANDYQDIAVIAAVPNETEPKSYLGDIVFSSGSRTQFIDIRIDVFPKGSLFDIITEMDQRYASVLPGEYLKFDVTLFKFLDVATEDVTIVYLIKDTSGNVLWKESDTRAVHKELEYNRELRIPSDLPPGDYLLETSVNYQGKAATSELSFTVVSPAPEAPPENYLFQIELPAIKIPAEFFTSRAFISAFPRVLLVVIILLSGLKPPGTARKGKKAGKGNKKRNSKS